MGNTLLIAIIVGWIMTVCLHEYAHALAAFLAGDRSVRDRGYLTMNPLLYIDPVNSILFPALMLWLGGIPLPGGAVMIDRSALRRPWQASVVSAAGPLTNLLLFFLLAALIHPKVGLVQTQVVGSWPTWAVFAGAMAFLQVFAVLLNLIPVPPLDGFNVIEPFLKPTTRERIMHSRISSIGFFLVFAAFFFVPQVADFVFRIIFAAFTFVGIEPEVAYDCYQFALFGAQ